MGIPILQSMVSFIFRAKKKLKNKHITGSTSEVDNHHNTGKKAIIPALTPMMTPARVFIRKASRMAFFSKKKSSTGTSSDEEVVKEREEAVWRRTILMGEKCEPLDFNGVIYYDSEGKRLDQVPPKSPRHPMGELVRQLPSFASPARRVEGPVSTARAW